MTAEELRQISEEAQETNQVLARELVESHLESKYLPDLQQAARQGDHGHTLEFFLNTWDLTTQAREFYVDELKRRLMDLGFVVSTLAPGPNHVRLYVSWARDG